MRIPGSWLNLRLTNFTTQRPGPETLASADRTLNDDNGDGNNNTENRAANAQSDVSLPTRSQTAPEELESLESAGIDPLSQVRHCSSENSGYIESSRITMDIPVVLTLSPAYPETDANREIASIQAKIADLLWPGFGRRRE